MVEDCGTPRAYGQYRGCSTQSTLAKSEAKVMEVTNAGWINVGILLARLNIRLEMEVDTQLKDQDHQTGALSTG